jgi:hypothetical protein
MASDTPKIIDIKHNDHEILWLECLEYLNQHCSSDELFENYKLLNPFNFEHFVGVVLDDRIVSFGAVDRQANRWGRGIVRALTRFWIHPEYRSQSLTKWTTDSIKYSPTVLEPQLKYIISQPNTHAVIITREGNYQRSFNEIIRLANTVTENKFVIMPGRYNVCGSAAVGDSCSQMVAISSLIDISAEEIFKQHQSMGYFKEL